jgi:hypothetical protein
VYGNCFYLQQNITPSGFAIKETAAGKITRTESFIVGYRAWYNHAQGPDWPALINKEILEIFLTYSISN